MSHSGQGHKPQTALPRRKGMGGKRQLVITSFLCPQPSRAPTSLNGKTQVPTKAHKALQDLPHPCSPLLPLSPSFTPHKSPRCSSNTPGTIQPQGFAEAKPSTWNVLCPDTYMTPLALPLHLGSKLSHLHTHVHSSIIHSS